MKILKGNIDVENKKEVYRLTKARGQMVQKLDVGKPMPVGDWLLYEDEKTSREGETRIETVLSFIAGTEKVSTISKTFIREFLDIVELMGDEPYEIVIVDGENTSGRRFVSCELVCD